MPNALPSSRSRSPSSNATGPSTTLSAASQTANDLVYKLAAEFRTRKGMPIELVRSVLEQAQELQRKLAERGESTPLLRHAAGAALNELAIALQEIGDLKTALEAAERARALVEKALAEEPTINSGGARISRSASRRSAIS